MGILLQLYIRNVICSCCINVDDRTAHQAIRSIQTSCRYVILYPLQQQQPQQQQSNGTTTNNFLTNLFGTATTSTTNTAKTQQHHPSNIREPQRARLVFQDSDVDGQPILCITPIESSIETNHDIDGDTNDNNNTTTTNIIIKLRRIDKIQLDGNQIVVYTKKKKQQKSNQSPSVSSTSSMPMEVLRFSILDPSSVMLNTGDDDNNDEAVNRTSHSTVTSNDNNNIVFISSDIRNSLVHHWMVLIEWERQRCIKVQSSRSGNTTNNKGGGNDSDTDDDDDDDHTNSNSNNTNFITRHAQKVKHYAQREIELQRMKRQREQRKSQLILQTGGLKYTALAMATSSSSMTSSSP